MSQITTSYDASTGLKRFEKLQLLRRRNINHLSFLLECKRRKVTPSFINLRCGPSSHRVNKALVRCEITILRALIKDVRSKLAYLEKELFTLYSELSSSLNPILWDIICSRCMTKVHYAGLQHKKQQLKKLQSLIQKKKMDNKKINPPVTMNDPIVNLSTHKLHDSEKQVLSLGLNFSIATQMDIKQVSFDVECGLKTAGRGIQLRGQEVPDQVNPIIQARSKIIETVKPAMNYKPNISTQEKAVLKSLSGREDILIMRADKGGQIAVVDKNNYITEVTSLLSNNNTYEIAETDSSNATLNTVKNAVKQSKILDSYERNNACPSSAVPARFYALPKVHKVNNTYRPIVSGIGTATYKLSQILAKKLSHLTTSNQFTIKDSASFVTKIKEQTLTQDTILVSFDVKSLFTNVPRAGALISLEKRLREHYSNETTIADIMTLVRVCTSYDQFIFNGTIYKQTEGLAMGNPLSPLLADLYMDDYERKMFEMAIDKPDSWLRYVDDVFSFWSNGIDKLYQFLDFLNSIDTNIQFTIEISDKQLPFLDVLVTIKECKLEFEVYRKPFSVCLPIHRRSMHPWSQKMSAFYYYIRRAMIICSNVAALNKEITFLKLVATTRGYSESIIDTAVNKIKRKLSVTINTSLQSTVEERHPKYTSMTYFPNVSSKISTTFRSLNIQAAFKPAKTIANCLKSTKDKIPEAMKWGIYRIYCECGSSYIGQTRRNLKIRAKEHESKTRNKHPEQSAVAKHSLELSHKFKYSEARIIFQPKYYSQLDLAEAIHIRTYKDSLVNSEIIPFLHSSWYPVLNKHQT